MNPGVQFAGAYIIPLPVVSPYASLSGSSGQLDLVPISFARAFTAVGLGARVYSTAAGSCYGVIYSSDAATGLPAALLHTTAALSTGTLGFVFDEATPFAFSAGVTYWVGLQRGSTAALLGTNSANYMTSIGLTASLASISKVSRSGTTPGTPPDPFTPVLAELLSGAAPFLIMKGAL